MAQHGYPGASGPLILGNEWGQNSRTLPVGLGHDSRAICKAVTQFPGYQITIAKLPQRREGNRIALGQDSPPVFAAKQNARYVINVGHGRHSNTVIPIE